MTTMTDYLEDEILDHMLGGVAGAWTAPTSIYMALSTASETPGEAGGAGTEPAGNGYARLPVIWGAASGGTKLSATTVSFTATGGNWGTIKSYALMDELATTSTNSLYYENLATANYITINDGDTLQFASDSITVTQG